MGRPLRLQFPGAVYHVTARGNRRATLFADARDHLAWLGILARRRSVLASSCMAFA